MSRVTYWVEYTYKYKLWIPETGHWFEDEDFDVGRFHCPKKNIKKEVTKAILNWLSVEQFKDLIVTIIDAYPTTDCEV